MQSSSCLSIGAPTSCEPIQHPDPTTADQWSTLGRLPILSGSVIAEQQLRMARRPKTLSEVRLATSNRFEHKYGHQAETGGLPIMLGSAEGDLTDFRTEDISLNLPPSEVFDRAARDARYGLFRRDRQSRTACSEPFQTGEHRQLMLTSIANSLPAPRPPLDPAVLRQLVEDTQNRRMERIAARLDFASSRRRRALRYFHPSIQVWIQRMVTWHNNLRFQSQIFATYIAQLRAH